MEVVNSSVSSIPVSGPVFLSHHIWDDAHLYANLTLVPCTFRPWYAYWIGGVATTALCTFAIFGNLICMGVLSRPVMRSAVNYILLVLSISDFVKVTTTLLMRGMQRIFESHCTGVLFTRWIQPILTPFLFPIATTAQVTSIYLTVLVSAERYVAVRYPFKARMWFSWRKSGFFCLGVFLFSFIYNFPTWFELHTQGKYSRSTGQFLGLYVRRTALYKNPAYILYYVNLGSFLVIRLIPFISLLLLNSLIYKSVRSMNRRRKTMTNFQSHEVAVARMLSCIVTLFLACNLVTIISHMIEAFHGFSPNELVSASNILVLFNAALNFLIYCFLSRNFRKVLLCLLGFRSDPVESTRSDAVSDKPMKTRQGDSHIRDGERRHRDSEPVVPSIQSESD